MEDIYELDGELNRGNGCNWRDYISVVLIRGKESRIGRVEID